jgi:hypothetical protein
MVAEAQRKHASLYLVNEQEDGRTDDAAISPNIDGVRAALGTCAMHSGMTPGSWERLHEAGKASTIVEGGPSCKLRTAGMHLY